MVDWRMNGDINPYAAPSVASFLESGESSPDKPFFVLAAERSLLRRRLVLARNGREWLLEYSGRGLRDTVRINGEPVVRKMAWVWFVPHFEFTLDGTARYEGDVGLAGDTLAWVRVGHPAGDIHIDVAARRAR